MIKAAIFDLDGTLADTLDDLGTAMNTMLRHFGWQERTRDELQSFINRGARVFVARSMPEGSWTDINDPIVTEALKYYDECYKTCFNEQTHPYDGIVETLAALKDSGVKMAVLSNKQDHFVRLICDRLFPDTFQVIRGHGPYPAKPSPESSLATAEELGVMPGECVFIGDSDVDMQTAKNAGMHPIGVSWGYRSADVLRDAGAVYIADTPGMIAEHILGL
ncbi:MAG: HAD family hydrolase [Clostridia bacterium]|nr:HAD family hydrolase [Clostridia bacterium]